MSKTKTVSFSYFSVHREIAQAFWGRIFILACTSEKFASDSRFFQENEKLYALSPNEILIGIYIFYGNRSTATFRKKESTLRLPGLKANGCSGLSLSGALLLNLQGPGVPPSNGSKKWAEKGKGKTGSVRLERKDSF